MVVIPEHEKRILMAYVLGVEPKELLNATPDPAQLARYEEILAQRAAGIPLQYLTGVAYFRTVSVKVGVGVFIPRPETEVMTGWAIAWLRANTAEHPATVVELCAGSGAISLAIATELAGLNQFAVEIDPQAYEWGQENLKDTSVQLRMQDMCDAFAELNGKVDLVIANPPYIPESDRALMTVEVIAHEPELALFSGADGLDDAKTVINTAKRLLRGGGALCFEHDARNAEATRALLHASQAFTTAESHLDLTGRPRFVCAIRNDQPGHRCEESVPKVRK